MVVPKILHYEVKLRAVRPKVDFSRPPVVYTGSLRSVEFQFEITDMSVDDLSTATATTLLYMRDGSFFQNPKEDVSLVGTTFSYTLKENEGKHAGIAKIELVVRFNEGLVNEQKFPSQFYEFEVINGLETKAAPEVMIYDWTTLTREARAYIDQFVADELLRDAEFDNNQFDRNTAFNQAQTDRTTAYGIAEDARDADYEENEALRQSGYDADHSRAGTDHTRADNDHTLAGTDRTDAATDRTNAATDRNLAATDHTRAESDHTRADADSATVAGFNTRLIAEETATAANKISAVKAKTFADVDARIEDVEADTTAMGTNINTNGDFSNGYSEWVITGSVGAMDTSTKVIGAQSLKLTPNGGGWCKAYRQIAVVVGRKYYFSTHIKNDAFTEDAAELVYINKSGLTNYANQRVANLNVSRDWTRFSTIMETNLMNITITYGLSFYSTVTTKSVWLDGVSVIDLTAAFGAGKEPTVEQMDAIMAKFTNSWFDGAKNLFRANAMLNKLMVVDARTEFEAKNEIVNGDFSKDTNADGIADNWVAANGPVCSLISGEQTIENVDGIGNRRIEQPIASIIGRKYYVRAQAKMVSGSGGRFQLYLGGAETILVSGATYTNYSQIVSSTISVGAVLQISVINAIGKMAVKNVVIIDLTAAFGAGKEPTLAEMDRLMARFPNSWFDGVKPIQTIETLYQEKANKVQEAWIAPTLINGWINRGASYEPVGYKKDELGTVRLKGSLNGGVIGSTMFTLPVGYRPAYSRYLPIIANNAANYLEITSAGTLVPWTNAANVSLDGVSFTI